MRIDQDLTYQEIATAMRISLGTVRTQLTHAHSRLRSLLEEHFGVFEL